MARQLLLSCLVAGSLVATDAWAHHKEAGRMHPVVTTVQIPQAVLAGGKPLASGTYELVINDERPQTGAQAPSDVQRVVEFVQNGTVVATEIAEVFPAAERPVGTSGSKSARAVVQRLRGDEFLRVAVNGADARYLIHLPIGQ
jgi:hypothetical protein